LAIDWDHQQLHVVAAVINAGNVRIQQAAVWPHPQTPNPAEAEALGKLLRDRLRQAGIAPAPVLACVGRDRVIVKDLRYPAVPASEEAGVVRFQAVKELTAPPEEVVIDYVRVGDGPNGERRAFAAILRRELLAAYQTLCRSAGLKLEALTPRPFGLAACAKRLAATAITPAPELAEGAVAVLAVAEHWAEFCIVRGNHLLLARSLAVGPGLVSEVRRNLAVFAGQQQQPVSGVYLAGTSDQSELRERLQDVLGIPVSTFDPFARVERPDLPTVGRGSFAGAVGLLHARAERKDLPINFIKIKQPQAKQDPLRVRLLLGGALAALLLVGAVIASAWKQSELEAEVDRLTARKTIVDAQLARLESDEKRLKALNEWADGDIVWLDELYDLTDIFTNNTNLRLSSFTGESLARNAKSKLVAKISLKGLTTDDHQPFKEMMDQLARDRHYRVLPTTLTPTRGVERFQFSQQFTANLEVEKLPPTGYTRRLRVTPLPGADDQNFGFPLFGGQ
jgi:Tfp pilus assembly PilM family ATPase